MQGGFGSYNNALTFSSVTQPQAAQGRTIIAPAINGQDTGRIMSPLTGTGGIATTTTRSQASNGILNSDKDVRIIIFVFLTNMQVC